MIYGMITAIAALVLIGCSVLFVKFIADDRSRRRDDSSQERRSAVPSPRLPASIETRSYIDKYFRR